jgi:hypothetical protein
MRVWVLALALTGCAAGNGVRDGGDALTRDLANRVAGKAETCIPAGTGQILSVIDRRTLTHERGGTIWVNRLEADCPGLRSEATLVVETQGARYCRGDRIRAIEPGIGIPGPICILRDFTPYRRR